MRYFSILILLLLPSIGGAQIVTSTPSVTSVFTRTGAITATSGDYTAAQVTNAADKSSGSSQNFSAGLQIPTGTVYQISSDTGISRDGAAQFDFGNGTNGDKSGLTYAASYRVANSLILLNNALRFGSSGVYEWASTSNGESGSQDTGLSRDSAAVVDVGNGNQGDISGTIKAATFTAGTAVNGAKYQTATNCSSSGGTCSSAAAGSVSIAAAATTVTVSTTAVTANSQIFIQEDSSLGTKLGVTCNTTTGRTYTVTARTGGTSFVITSSAAPAANPACLSYLIVN